MGITRNILGWVDRKMDTRCDNFGLDLAKSFGLGAIEGAIDGILIGTSISAVVSMIAKVITKYVVKLRKD